MRLQIASDLHLDALAKHAPNASPLEVSPTADVLVLAGDIHNGAAGIEAFADWPVPVIYVSGNHEAYGCEYRSVVKELRGTAEKAGIRYLERDITVIGDVRFIGACLWTDYDLYGNQQAGIDYARLHMSDHEAIRHSAFENFSPELALREHEETIGWFEHALALPHEGKTVVVTHHGVSPDSIHARYLDDPINVGFVSDLRHLLSRADLWIHGHVHDSFDYRHGRARVVANPRGYPLNLNGTTCRDQLRWENASFDPLRTVEI